MKTTPEERARLRALREAGTATPWEARCLPADGWRPADGTVPTPLVVDEAGGQVADCNDNRRGDGTADACLIAAAVNSLPALLDDVEEVERLLAIVMEVIADLRNLRVEALRPQQVAVMLETAISQQMAKLEPWKAPKGWQP